MKKFTEKYLIEAHDRSSSHKEEIIRNKFCGCFYCENLFESKEIKEWILEPKGGETACCPRCGIDSVLSSELPINDKEFLDQMNIFWFS